MLGALRMLPELVGHLLHGERPERAPASMRLRDLSEIPMRDGGWILLGERPGEEIALGLVGKFWRPVIEFAPVASAEVRRYWTFGVGSGAHILVGALVDAARRAAENPTGR